MFKLGLILALCLFGGFVAGNQGKYSIVKLYPSSQEQVQYLKGIALSDNPLTPTIITPIQARKSVYALVPIMQLQNVEQQMKENSIRCTVSALTTITHVDVDDSAHDDEELPQYSTAWLRDANCDCDYHSGGCTISKAPPKDHKCKCVYKGAWTCTGYTFGCDPHETCPENCNSRQCCQTGGGDCGGY